MPSFLFSMQVYLYIPNNLSVNAFPEQNVLSKIILIFVLFKKTLFY